jgi:hypothetical protein
MSIVLPTKKVKVENSKSLGTTITIVKDLDKNTEIDKYYHIKVNNMIGKIREQNNMVDDKIRFGWNSGDN